MSGLRIGYVAVHDALLLERMAKLSAAPSNGATPPRNTRPSPRSPARGRDTAPWPSSTRSGATRCGTRSRTRRPARGQARGRLLLVGAHRRRLARPRGDGTTAGRMTDYLIDRAGVGSAPGEVFGSAVRATSLRVFVLDRPGAGGRAAPPGAAVIAAVTRRCGRSPLTRAAGGGGPLLLGRVGAGALAGAFFSGSGGFGFSSSARVRWSRPRRPCRSSG